MPSRALVSVYTVQGVWYDLPTPSQYSGLSSTLVDSARNTKGVVVGDVVKSDVAKIEITWNFLSTKEYSKIAQLFEPKYNNNDKSAFFRPVAFFDVILGDFDGNNSVAPSSTNNCRVMYPNDRSVKFANIKLDSNGMPVGYTEVSLHLIDTGRRSND